MKQEENEDIKREYIVSPETKEMYSLDFSTKFSLSTAELKKIIEFHAVDYRNNEPVLVNETLNFYVDMNEGRDTPDRIVIGLTGIEEKEDKLIFLECFVIT